MANGIAGDPELSGEREASGSGISKYFKAASGRRRLAEGFEQRISDTIALDESFFDAHVGLL